MTSLRLNLGAGDSKIEGFTSVDLYDDEADVRADICDLPFPDESVDEIVAYQVIEHVPYQRSEQMFGEMYRVLKPGGTVILETPDVDIICRNILRDGLLDKWVYSLVGEYYRPWDKERYDDWESCAAAIHRNPWNFLRLLEVAAPMGFDVQRIEPTQIVVEENMAACLTK